MIDAKDHAAVDAALAKLPFGPQLTPADYEALHRVFERRTAKAGEALIVQGTQGAVFYILTAGRVTVRRHEPDGSEKILATLEPGSYFGELSLMLKAPRSASVRMEEDGEILTLAREAFTGIIMKNPAAAETIRRIAIDRQGGGVVLELEEAVGKLLRWTGLEKDEEEDAEG